MKKCVIAAALLLSAAATSYATTIELYVDSAPNVYGSPDYASWWSDTKTGVANGTIQNMANGFNPANIGTTNFELEDAVVYSFGDLGNRLHFTYFISDTDINTLTAANFEIRVTYDWDGTTYDAYNPAWALPTKWENFNGGVIGTAGMAYWGAYGVNTQEALDADLAAWRPYTGDMALHLRFGDQSASLTAHHHVPDGVATAVLLGHSFIGLAWAARQR